MLLFIFARNVAHTEHSSHGRLLKVEPVSYPEGTSTPNILVFHNKSTRAAHSAPSPKPPEASPSTAPTPTPTPTPAPTPSPSDQPELNPTSTPTTSAYPPSLSAPEPSPPGSLIRKSSSHRGPIMAGAIGGASVVILIVGLYFYGCNKVATVKPWATGLSGQLQKAFVTGIASFVMEKIDLCKLKFLLISNCHAVVTVKPPLCI